MSESDGCTWAERATAAENAYISDFVDFLLDFDGIERVELLRAINDAATEDICRHCGCNDPDCMCWNDE